MAASFTASGLASGLDTATIVDQLVALRKVSITQVQKKQSGLNAESSAFGDLAGRLSSLKSTFDTLTRDGLRSTNVTSVSTAFSASTAAGAVPGRFTVNVEALASAAKSRSAQFANADAPVKGGNLNLVVQGATFDIAITDGMKLSDVAKAINASGAQVNANVLSTGTEAYLSITNRNTGFAVGGVPADALKITETTTGTSGQALGLTTLSPAANAKVRIDGLLFERASNTVSDAVTGTTINLKALSSTTEDLVVADDNTGALARMKIAVASLNNVLTGVKSLTAPGAAGAARGALAGDSTAKALERQLQALGTTLIPGLAGSARSLADLGLRTERDGSVTLNEAVFNKAIAASPDDANKVFQQANTGLGALVSKLADTWTNSSTGLLVQRQQGIKSTVKRMDDDIVRLQGTIDAYRSQLVSQFSAMEKVVSGLKSTGNFLTSNQYLFTGVKSTS